ncbi:PucR family transcriptional regulator [Actinokineospora bangkokensis]|uniref:Uncharacterized protein n=1 Tax=Actinokineospora bangkokensis TaxID=1193682 RepID=A0A1Q9LMI1_9PSEU|nr:helix-turn-helix domain-containing protein [Actinokineospora bangkokensis]OLR93238.1 hypothetical protein BJP25_17275 [Actinokineospora bangkokensis]
MNAPLSAARAEVVRAALDAVGPLPRAAATTAAVLAEAGFAAVVQPGAAQDSGWRRLAAGFGMAERRAGRPVDDVHVVVGRAARAGWHRLTALAAASGTPPEDLLPMADRVFEFTEALLRAITAGHVLSADRVSERAALLRDLAHGVPAGDMPRRAAAAGWSLPDRVVAVVPAHPVYVDAGDLDERVLVDTTRPCSCALLPPEAVAAAVTALAAGAPVGVGLPVPVHLAHRSAHYARQVVELARAAGSPPPVVHAADHLGALVARSDRDLARLVLREDLGPLAAQSPARRDRLVRTLAAWLDLHGDVRAVADHLDLHTETVRSRLRHLDGLVGPAARSPDTALVWRLALNSGLVDGR